MRRSVVTISCCVLSLMGPFSGTASVSAQPAPGTADFNPSRPPTQTLVLRGETLYTIAERTRSPLQALINTNRLAPPYAVSAGQILILPPLKVHVVGAEETFTAIARRYSVDERSLAVFNRLVRPVQLQIGQRIILPPLVIDRLTGLEPQDLVDLLTNELNAGRQITGTLPGQIVRNEEAAAPASTQILISPRVIIRRQVGPSIDDGGTVMAQALVNRARYGPSEDADGVAVRPRVPARPNLVQTNTQRVSLVPRTRDRLQSAPAVLPGVTDMPASSASSLFMWPVAGRIVETFGAKRDFRTLDGIEIEAPAATPFKAIANGQVVYVGNQLPGYGWLVLIRHADNIMSAYAYAQSVNVRENQNVTRGQVIGLVGTTGRATTPRLHFQIRYNTRPIDPLTRLPRLQAAA